MTEPATLSPVSLHRNRWKWFLALGAVLLGLGLAGVTAATLLELTSVLVFGPLLLASSLMQFMTAVFSEKGRESLLHIVAAGLEAFFGFVIMATPPQSVGGLITLVAVVLAAGGLVRLARALAAQSRGRSWAAVSGIIALLLSVSLWVGWPAAKLWIAGVFIAVDFICHGVSWSAAALMERKPLEVPVA